jgi:hypothetical protein
MITTLLLIALAAAGQHPAMPPGMTHEEHQAQMKKDAELKARGETAMGFDQSATTHHFRLTANGGAIDVSVNDAKDEVTRTAIRAHLKEIATQFSAGNFGKPVATHAETPPGVDIMRQLRADITYSFEESATGGRVRISTGNPTALAAVHDFLRYQIGEHATGDPLTVQR